MALPGIRRSHRIPLFAATAVIGTAVIVGSFQMVSTEGSSTPAVAAETAATTQLAGEPSDRSRRPIYLTFDDGPTPRNTPDLLRVLEANGVKATFFVVGKRVARNPDLLLAEDAAGHAIGNHTWSHQELTRLRRPAVVRQLVDGGNAIRAGIGDTPGCMRPPYGSTDGTVQSVNRQLHLKQVLWSVDTNDWQKPSVRTLTRRILSARPGEVVLMHDGGGSRSRTNAAVARALPRMLKRGDHFSTIQSCR